MQFDMASLTVTEHVLDTCLNINLNHRLLTLFPMGSFVSLWGNHLHNGHYQINELAN